MVPRMGPLLVGPSGARPRGLPFEQRSYLLDWASRPNLLSRGLPWGRSGKRTAAVRDSSPRSSTLCYWGPSPSHGDVGAPNHSRNNYQLGVTCITLQHRLIHLAKYYTLILLHSLHINETCYTYTCQCSWNWGIDGTYNKLVKTKGEDSTAFYHTSCWTQLSCAYVHYGFTEKVTISYAVNILTHRRVDEERVRLGEEYRCSRGDAGASAWGTGVWWDGQVGQLAWGVVVERAGVADINDIRVGWCKAVNWLSAR